MIARPARPDLAVIDRAIAHIRRGVHPHWSCIALVLESGDVWNEKWKKNPYVQQYTASVRSHRADGRLPSWWGYLSSTHSKARIKCLQQFRQDCVDAGRRRV